VLGNPSAGGAYQSRLLPGLWRTIGPALPNGAGVQAVRTIAYFGGHGVAGNLTIIAAYVAAAIALTLIGTWVVNRPGATDKLGSEHAESALAYGADTPSLVPAPVSVAGVHTTALPPP
jgi:hypothetical protein